MMTLSLTLLPALLCAGALAGVSGAPKRAGVTDAEQIRQQQGVPAAYHGELPSLAALNIRDARLDTLLTGLDRPWAFEFLADDEVLISEIDGRLLRYRFGTAAAQVVEGLPAIATGQEQTGLFDVALHPDYARNGRIYFSYASENPAAAGYYMTVVATALLRDLRLESLDVLLEAGPYGWSPSNFGGALAFDEEGFLYVSIGDRSEHDLAQRGDRLQGKILRLHDDGRTPKDNPFVDDPGIDERIFALGVRNPQGLYFDPPSGRLYEAEHGPLGGDEVNIIRAGANYGWPTITYGKTYAMEPLGVGTHQAGMRQPLYYYLPSIATSPLLVYRGTMFAEWDGDVLVGALKGQHVSWLDVDNDGPHAIVRSEYPILNELTARIRDLKTAPDGSIHILTQSGNLHRLHRPPRTAQTSAPVDPAVIYALVCAGCHDHGAYQAPNPVVASEWARILAQPIEQTRANTLEGKGNMPARGLCEICTDQHLRDTVDWLLERVRGAGPTAEGSGPG
jgi:glucose/arabinose dehydrogenase